MQNKSVRQACRLLAAAAAASIACGMAITPALAAEDCKLNGVEVNDSNGATTAGKTGIMRCTDRENGKLTREREFRAGERIGLRRDYTDGVLRFETLDRNNGNEPGMTRKYAANKQLIFEEIEHSKLAMERREWTESGKLQRVDVRTEEKGQKDEAQIRYTSKGQLNGLQCGKKPLLAPHADDASLCGFKGKPSNLEYFQEGGALYARETYLAGVTQKYEEFYLSGKPRRSYALQGKQGLEIEYNQAGAKLLEVLWDEAEKPRKALRKARYHESGTLVSEQQFAMLEIDGKRRHFMTLEASYYLNGQPKTRESYTIEAQGRVMDIKQFHDNGKLASQGRYLEAGPYGRRALGVVQVFNENGVLIAESHHDDKGNVNRERSFDESGKLLKDEQLFEDGSRKAFAK